MFRSRFIKCEEAGDGEGSTTSDTRDAEILDLKGQLSAMQSKTEQLLSETKQAKSAKRETEESARAEAEASAKKAGDYEGLFKASEAKNQELVNSLDTLNSTIANEKRNSEALRMAGLLADGSNAELLATFIQNRLKYTEDGLKVTDATGQLTVSTLDDLTNEFKNDARYSALLKGNQSSGGGATGGKNSGSAAQREIGRAEFDALNPIDKMKHVKSGGSII